MTIERREIRTPFARILLGDNDHPETLQPGTSHRYKIIGKITIVDDQSVTVQMPLSPKVIRRGEEINTAHLFDRLHWFPPGRITEIVWTNNIKKSNP